MGCYAVDVLGRGDLVKGKGQDVGNGRRRKRVIELGGGVGYLA